ncbi:MAG: ribbon-helix-helix protein, CopG family [Treponema sp.]|nr:ribbon-helix-helix protein, CopG family [Treponema sp.]
MAEEEKKYSGYGYHGGGRKKGSGSGTKRVSFSVSCQPEELEKVKSLAEKAGKSVSRFLLDLAFKSE